MVTKTTLYGFCFQKVELKVCIHCCDGCKRKVKKVLRRTEGVFKTELDPMEPKVTVLGNVEPHILIKKLRKDGKQAEIWSYNNQNGQNGEKDVNLPHVNGKENSASESAQTEHKDTLASSTDKLTDTEVDREGTAKKAPNKDTNGMTNTSATPGSMNSGSSISQKTEANCIRNLSIAPDAGKVTIETNTQYCYMVEPRPVIPPYYTIYPYRAPPLEPKYTCSRELYDNGRITYQPSFQGPVTKVGDYFSNENTVGCQVM